MTKFDQIRILDNKIKANKAQYMLDRKNTEISSKSSGELDKYEYLTGKDLDYKPDALTQANLSTLLWVKPLLLDRLKKIEKSDCLKD